MWNACVGERDRVNEQDMYSVCVCIARLNGSREDKTQ